MTRNQSRAAAMLDSRTESNARRDTSQLSRPAASPDTHTTHSLPMLAIGTTVEEPQDPITSIIYADLLIPGRGDPIQKAALAVSNAKISWVGVESNLPSSFLQHKPPTTRVRALMPGLWDCHIHLIGFKNFDFSTIWTESPITQGARLARGLHDILMSGFTSVRDLGSWACEAKIAVEEGVIPGPNIYAAGAALSQTAGHGDTFNVPVGWAWGRCSVGPMARGDSPGSAPLLLVDGVTECRKAVRLQIRRGAKVIKIFASGGVLSIGDNPHQQQFSDEEMCTIVEEAARHDRIVAAHVHGKKGIMAALRAGVGTLEHGTYLDEEAIALMKDKGVMLVATATIVHEGLKHPELMDPDSYVKMKETAAHHAKAYSLAIKSGVKIALGTDLGISVPHRDLSHGKGGAEPFYAVDAGMTPLQAIEAATANGPDTLGPQAPKSGQLKVGYDADFIALETSPLDDISVLKDPANITRVWKGGKLFKTPGGGGSIAWDGYGVA